MLKVPGFLPRFLGLIDSRPWMVLGKGPSFPKHRDFNLSSYNSVGLNHVVCKLPQLDFVHMTDIEVLDGVADVLMSSSKMRLILPFFPHVKNRPDVSRSVDIILNEKTYKHRKLLVKLYNEDRIFTYLSSLSSRSCRRKDIGPKIYVRYFSSVAVVNLLAGMKVKDITIIGIDGGTVYSKEFSGLVPLTNGRQDFDCQFKEIDKTVHKHKIQFRRIIP
jgi:hypothetical protein